jgi:hypothetical protein
METSIRALFFYDVERKFEKFSASGGSADTVITGRKRTVLAASLDKLITSDLGRFTPSPPPLHPRGGGGPRAQKMNIPEQILEGSVEGYT